MKYCITNTTIGYGFDSVVGGQNFEGTYEEAVSIQNSCKTLEQCKDDKISLLKTKFQEYKDTHIRLDYDSNTYYIKATEDTMIEASTRELRVDQLSDPITNELDRSWFSDFNASLESDIIQIIFSSKLELQTFLGKIGQYFQSKKQVYLVAKQQILSATTIAELEAIDLEAIDWGSNIIEV